MGNYGAVTLCLLLLSGASVADDEIREQKRAFFEMIGRPPLGRRAGPIWDLAGTRHPDAFRVLVARYGTAKSPKDFERYILVRACSHYFREKEHVDAWLSWAVRNPNDPWLSYHALSIAAPHGTDRVLAWARKPRRALALAAALEAIKKEPNACEIATAILAKLPRRKDVQPPIIAACASVFLAQSADRTKKELLALGEALVEQMARKGVAPRTKLTIARQFAAAYSAPVSLNPSDWRKLMGFEALGEQKGHTRSFRSKFAGVESAGTRIAYLIDLSDSMMTPVSDHVRAELKLQPMSRFDLARAFLIQSVKALPEDAVFTIVGFGTRANYLRNTPGLVQARPDRVKAVIAELKAIRPGAARRDRPHGTLLGATNLHGALLRGFRAKWGGHVPRLEHMDPAVLKSGCDTIFLLSDGDPNEDDFGALDRNKGGTVTTDTEKGTTRNSGAGTFRFYGPYVRGDSILRDLERLNLYRKVGIHCVGIGEANDALLTAIAKAGLGRYQKLEAAR